MNPNRGSNLFHGVDHVVGHGATHRGATHHTLSAITALQDAQRLRLPQPGINPSRHRRTTPQSELSAITALEDAQRLRNNRIDIHGLGTARPMLWVWVWAGDMATPPHGFDDNGDPMYLPRRIE